VLEEIKARTGRTFAQVALNWCLSHPNVIVIPKSNSIDRIIENCGASDWRLSNDDFALLNDAFRRDDDDDWN
jgi:diketogulonate reductase-like aldo/keto reductase